MHRRDDERQEEHGEYLAAYRAARLAAGKADLAHDVEPALVLVALAHLLVVDDEHGGHHEHQAEEHAEEEESARQPEDIALHVDAGIRSEVGDVAAIGRREVVVLGPECVVERVLLRVAERGEVVAALPIVDAGNGRLTYLV